MRSKSFIIHSVTFVHELTLKTAFSALFFFSFFSLQKTPVEFFGLPFDDKIFRDVRCDGPHGILTSCNGVLRDICRERIYDDNMDLLSKQPQREVMEKFLMGISKLHPEYKERCFDNIVSALGKGGQGLQHVRDRLIEGLWNGIIDYSTQLIP